MPTAAQRDAAVASQQAQSKAEDAQRAAIQSQIDASNVSLHNAPGSISGSSGGSSLLPAQIQLQKLYAESGVVTDPKSGNVIYNPADLGSSREDAVKQSLGLPTAIKTGSASPEYQNAVNIAAGRQVDLGQSKRELERLASEKTAQQNQLDMREQEIQSQLKSIDSKLGEQVVGSTYIDKNTGRRITNTQSPYGYQELDRLDAQRQSLNAELSSIAAKRDFNKKELSNISNAQKGIRTISLQNEYSRLFNTQKPNLQQATGGQAASKSFTTASIKSAVPPIQNRSLMGSDVTARELMASKGSKTKLAALNKREIQSHAISAFGGVTINQGSNRTRNAAPPKFDSSGNLIQANPRKTILKNQPSLASHDALSVVPEGIPVEKKTTVSPSMSTIVPKTPEEIKAKQEYFSAFKSNQKGIADYIASAKNKGATQISILDENNKVISTVPINRAFYDISKQGNKKINLQATGTPSERTAGFSQDSLGVVTENKVKGETFSNGVFYPNEPQKASVPTLPSDPLSRAAQSLALVRKSSNPLIQAGAGIYSEFQGAAASLVNLNNLGANEFAKIVSGNKNRIIGPQNVQIAETSPGTFTGHAFSGGMSAVEKKNPKAFFSELAEGGSLFYQDLTKKPIRTLAEVGGFIFPAGTGLLKAVPLGIKPITLSLKGESQLKTVARVVTAGYGDSAKPILTYSGGKLSRGLISPESPSLRLKEITDPFEERGFEVATAKPFTQKYLTREQTLDYLIKSKTINTDDATALRNLKTISEGVKDLKVKKFAEDFGQKPIEPLSAGAQTRTLVKSLKREQGIPNWLRGRQPMGAIKGSLSESPQLPESLRAIAGDFDVDAKSLPQAYGLAERTSKSLSPVAKEGENFFPSFDTSAGRVNLQVGRNEKKIGEFLFRDKKRLAEMGLSEADVSQTTKGQSVFGTKYSKRSVKLKGTRQQPEARGVKIIPLKNQILSRVASVSSITGERTMEGIEGGRVGPPARRAKDVSKLYVNSLVASSILKGASKTYSEGVKVREAAESLKSIYGKRGVDTDQYIRDLQRGTAQPEPYSFSKSSSVAQSIASQAQKNRGISSIIGTSKTSQRPRQQNRQSSFIQREKSEVPYQGQSTSIRSIVGRGAKVNPSQVSKIPVSVSKPTSKASRYTLIPPQTPHRSSPITPYSPSGYGPRSPPSSGPSPFGSSPPPSGPSVGVPDFSPPYVPPYKPLLKFPPIPNEVLGKGTGKPLFPWGGGRSFGRRFGQRGHKEYSVYNVSAVIPRAMIDAGPFKATSRSPKIYKTIDEREIKALKKRSKQGGFNKTLFGLDTRKNRKKKY